MIHHSADLCKCHTSLCINWPGSTDEEWGLCRGVEAVQSRAMGCQVGKGLPEAQPCPTHYANRQRFLKLSALTGVLFLKLPVSFEKSQLFFFFPLSCITTHAELSHNVSKILWIKLKSRWGRRVPGKPLDAKSFSGSKTAAWEAAAPGGQGLWGPIHGA